MGRRSTYAIEVIEFYLSLQEKHMMSQLAWEVEKKVECFQFPNNLRGREIWNFLEFMFKPKAHILLFCTLFYISFCGPFYISFCGPPTNLWLHYCYIVTRKVSEDLKLTAYGVLLTSGLLPANTLYSSRHCLRHW